MDWDDYSEDEDSEYNDNEYGEDEDYEDVSHFQMNLNLLELMMSKAGGTSFILMMESPHQTYNSERNFSLHARFHQPCYGELRKYESTHPGDCTQTGNEKPSDLYYPFPDGKPRALGLPYWQYGPGNLTDASDEFFKEFFMDDNPWVSGFGGVQNIKFYMHTHNGKERIGGVILNTCKVDPTVTVSMSWFIRAAFWGDYFNKFRTLRDNGLTKLEAYAFLMCNGGNMHHVIPSDSYHWASSFSMRRFLEQKPNDLTGGTLEDRYDYNRSDIQDLWCSNFYKGNGWDWADILNEERSKEKDKNLFKAAKTTLERIYNMEGVIEARKFDVTTTNGTKQPLPFDTYFTKKSLVFNQKAA